MFHRVVWSFLFLTLLLVLRKEWPSFRVEVRKPKVVRAYLMAAILLAVNWVIYIYGVNSGQVVETSLGYFINPLVNVGLGVIFLRERLRPMQWAPVGIAAMGVLYLTVQYGQLPWIALGLAFTFGFYGLIKKVAPLGPLHGLTLETAILFLPGLLYLLYLESQGAGNFPHAEASVTLLLALAGVITAIPLLMFATAARAIPLYMLGILQYIAPTCQFLIGVLVFNEPFTSARVVGFSLIWIALLLYAVEGGLAQHRSTVAAASD
jgi:chloramphenicol-sensitive protein RarD